MTYGIGIAQGQAIRNGAAARDGAVRDSGLTMIAVARVATGVAVGGARLEAPSAETASHVRRGVEGVKASPTKTTGGMKAAASMKTATPSGMETPTTMEAATAMETATTPATTRFGYAWERQPHDCAREDPGERQANPIAIRRFEHVFLHLN